MRHPHPRRPRREGSARLLSGGLLLLAGALVSGACKPTSAPPEATPEPRAEAVPLAVELAEGLERPIDVDDPTTCAACHGVVYAEWTESMHARAHHTEDPLYAGMRAFRLSKGHAIEGKCETCHAPRAGDRLDGPAARAGVSCSACHNVVAVHAAVESHGAQQLEAAPDDTMRSARDVADGRSPVHGNGPALPAIADGKTLCLACHGHHTNPAGIPVCTTGSELDAHGGDATCVSCHMPEVDGPSGPVSERDRHRSHRFPGPHRAYLQDDPSLLAKSARMELEIADGQVRVRLENRSGHALPSGFPGRLLTLRLRGFDARGREVWRGDGAPGTVLRRVFLDAEGAPTMPPFAQAAGPDTRLAPDEVRTLALDVPPAVVRVDAALEYRLIPPKAAQRMGLSEDGPLAEPVTVLTKTAQRPG